MSHADKLDKKGDSFFSSKNRKGESTTLKKLLNDLDQTTVKTAVKKVIAHMTVGKDVSSLFTDVIKNMHTTDVELKKLIYLYIINYARVHPDKAILIVSSFQKDCADPNPLIRALALRTMGCIRVDQINEYLCEPLGKALKDDDPYVRKTAATCVAKLHEFNPELAEEQGFLETLRNLIADSNAMVVTNAVAALAEISENAGKDMMRINKNLLAKLLFAINESAEWGQVYILDCLAKYEPTKEEAEDIIERVSPRLKHVNPAVSMSAIKVIVKYLSYIDNPTLERLVLTEKLPPPLITLLSDHKPEIQYVALRNINIICQKYDNVLPNSVKHFFVKYNDPPYVKMEKLEVLIRIAHTKNIDKVLSELNEYAREVDVQFVRRAVLAIGRCAIKLEKAAEKCMSVLLELIKTRVKYVVQQAIVVIKDIFRKYPNRYEKFIATLCEHLDSLEDTSAKAAMIWILGEYAHRIENSAELLEYFAESFLEEQAEVQLATLTAVVKLFIKGTNEQGKDLCPRILTLTTEKIDNPDLRDRAYMYWRLLHSHPKAAEAMVCGKKPEITEDSFNLDQDVMKILISNLSSLASVYQKPPEMFVYGAKAAISLKKTTGKQKKADDEDSDSDSSSSGSSSDSGSSSGDESDDGLRGRVESDDEAGSDSSQSDDEKEKGNATVDILDMSMLGLAEAVKPMPTPKARVVLPKEKGKGLEVANLFVRRNNTLGMEFTLTNNSAQQIAGFQVRLDANFYLGVANAEGRLKVNALPPGATATCFCPIKDTPMPEGAKRGALRMLMNAPPLGSMQFSDRLAPYYFFDESGNMEKNDFLAKWGENATNQIKEEKLTQAKCTAAEALERFKMHNIFLVAERDVPQKKSKTLFCALKFKGQQVQALLEFGEAGVTATIRPKTLVSKVAMDGIHELLAIKI